MPDHEDYADSRKVAEIARQRVIAALGEPDLLAEE